MEKEKYICVMFPYPSGDGLHIGHAYNYAIIDSYCRYWRSKGYKVFQPFGYDAFGLPAENYARKVGRDPREVTYQNIDNFRRQMDRMDTDYEELLVTSDPSYQKWTQWLFLKLKEHNLAYKAMGQVNWCSSCETVLAREQCRGTNIKHDDRKFCERCSSEVESKDLEQWYFRITAYKDRLIAGLDKIDYPSSTIAAQRVWLSQLHDWCVSRQRKWGCPIPIEGETDTLDTFVDSAAYFVRYCDSENETEFCSKEQYRQVDVYVGGNEHACMHLLYARFIHMFLYDIGVVPTEEPFQKVIHQGMILNEGEKMSKTKGNVVNPDLYNSDELRFYLMFLGHYFDGGSWSDQHIAGVRKFIKRWKAWMDEPDGNDTIDVETFSKKIDANTEAFKFNKVVSEFMTFYNTNKSKKISVENKNKLKGIIEIYMPGINK